MGKTLNTKQNMYLIIGIFLISLLVLGGTYAWLQDFTATNNVIAGNTTCFNINYDITNDSDTNSEHGTDIAGTLFPSGSAGGGLSGNVSIGISSACSINGFANIYLNVTSGGSTLFQTVGAHCENSKTLKSMTSYTTQSTCEAQTDGVWVTNGTALKYAIYTTNNTSGSDPVSVGYIKQTGNMTIYENFSIAPSTVNYYVYVWLDGYLSDNTYQNQSFAGTISADASQVNG